MAKKKEEVSKPKKITLKSGTMVMCDDGEKRPVTTRDEAIDANSNRYFTGITCPNGHMAERKVTGYVCVACARERAKARRKRRMETDEDFRKKIMKKRKEKHIERYKNDPEYRARVLERSKQSRLRRAEVKKKEGVKGKAEAEITG